MSWKKKKRVQGKNKNHSLSKKLKQDKKITEEFEVMMNNLSLEELIGLKLELASKVLNGRLFGLPIWHSMHTIVQDAVLKWVFSASRTQGEAMRFLGLKPGNFHRLMKKYQITSFFLEENDKEEILN